jgi:hypothetical protein
MFGLHLVSFLVGAVIGYMFGKGMFSKFLSGLRG